MDDVLFAKNFCPDWRNDPGQWLLRETAHLATTAAKKMNMITAAVARTARRGPVAAKAPDAIVPLNAMNKRRPLQRLENAIDRYSVEGTCFSLADDFLV
jgi:hypothetical protein